MLVVVLFPKGAIQCQWLVTEGFDNVGSCFVSKGAIQCQRLVTEVLELLLVVLFQRGQFNVNGW